MKTVNKSIVVLSQYEHLRKRPEMYVGSITPTEERLPIIENNRIVECVRSISVGMYKCFDEIFDNAFDELKRQQSKKISGEISVFLDTKTDTIRISDNGGGFIHPDQIHATTGKSNVETALSELRAGSNFDNDDITENLIGTNGVGAAIVNILSSHFSVITCDGDVRYTHVWENFETVSTHKEKYNVSGTTIEFSLDKSLFSGLKWDIDVLKSKLIFKHFLIRESTDNISLKFFVNGLEQNLSVNFIPENHLMYTKVLPRMTMKMYLWERTSNSTSVSFVNDSMCQGIHQKIVTDEINRKLFEYDKAHNYYETFIILNMLPRFVKFGDQNKTKFIGTRNEIQNIIQFDLTPVQCKNYKKLPVIIETIETIEDTIRKDDLKKIKKSKRQNRIKVSEKYFPSEQQHTLFLVEGNSAAGSLLQERNPKIHGVYTLRGKIRNTQHLSDLSGNQEIMDLISILDLDLESGGAKCKFKQIIIACDADADGAHISSLIINFFFKWFPKIIRNKKLFILETPLIRAERKKKRIYFYNHSDFLESEKKEKYDTIKYLKGLGSLDSVDWKMIFEDPQLRCVYIDINADKILEIAFGSNAMKRRRWLAK